MGEEKKKKRRMLNQIIMEGRLTDEPEVVTGDAGSRASFTIACDRGGEHGVDFVECKAFRYNAGDIRNKMEEGILGKGTLVTVVGRLTTGSYTDKEGIKRKGFGILLETKVAIQCQPRGQEDDESEEEEETTSTKESSDEAPKKKKEKSEKASSEKESSEKEKTDDGFKPIETEEEDYFDFS